MEQIVRPILTQPFSSFLVVAGVVPTAVGPTLQQGDLITSFIVSVDAGAANNVFIGDQGVTVATGIEIVAGAGPVLFEIRDERMQYELLRPLLAGLESMQCRENQATAIPIIVWDLSQVYLVAVANTNVRIMPFRAQFV